MKRFTLISAALAAFVTASAPAAQATDATLSEETTIRSGIDANLADFLWLNRPIVVFADTPNDPRFIQQMDLIEARIDELEERDVVVLVDTDPAQRGAIRTKLRPRGFMITLIGKDGQVKLRKPVPWDVRELTRQIDKMPLRKQEIRDALRAGE